MFWRKVNDIESYWRWNALDSLEIYCNEDIYTYIITTLYDIKERVKDVVHKTSESKNGHKSDEFMDELDYGVYI